MIKALLAPPTTDQVIALAGIFLACNQVDSYARLGTGTSKDVETAMFSLLNQNPDNTESVYRSFASLENGFAAMERILDNPKDQANAMILRYVLGVLHLARKLSANPAMLKKIGDGLTKANNQAQLFTFTHANVLANIADLYQQTLSTFSFRIQVNGVASHLQQQATASKIRCLLFAAVRSAILWQQVGGSRIHLMFRRDRILTIARELHKEARRLALEEPV